MSLISVSQAQDGVTGVNAAAINTPVNTIVNDYNGNITDANIASNAAIAGSKINFASIANPYKFSVYRNGAYTTTSSANTKMPFDTKLYDTGSNFDATTNFRFTAPIAGFYHFTAGMNLNTATAQFVLMLFKNGSEVKRVFNETSSGALLFGGTGGGDLQLAANDYVEVFYFLPNANVLTTGQIFTYFDGFLISAT